MSLLRHLIASMGSSAPDTDPYFSNVALLLHMDGSNGGTTFTDSSSAPKAFTAGSGSPTTVTGVSGAFGTAVYHNNSTSDYITATSSSFTVSANADFAYEARIYTTGSAGYQRIFNHAWGAGAGNIIFRLNPSYKLEWYFSGSAQTTGSTTVTQNAWHHVAMVRVGGVVSIYLDGVKEGSSVTDTSSVGTSTNFLVGGGSGGAESFQGYIEEVRVTPGIARYTNNFSVPTKAFPNTAPANQDYLYASTSLLMHADGVNTGTTFSDSSVNNFTLTPTTVTTSTVQIKMGDASAYFNTSTTNKIQLPTDSKLTLDGDFTVEYWIYPTTIAGKSILNCNASGTAIRCDSGGYLYTYDNSGYVNTNAASFLTLNAWQHVAHVRSGTTHYIFKDGVSSALTPGGSPGTAVFDFSNGTVGDGTSTSMQGYLDDLRITKGAARYVANFTPPTAPFANGLIGNSSSYATWNPSDKSASLTLSGGNLVATPAGANQSVRATSGKSAGKWYFEFVNNNVNSMSGIGLASASLNYPPSGDANGWGYYGAGGSPGIYNNNTLIAAAATYSTSVIGIGIDNDNNKALWFKDNVLQAITTIAAGTWYPMAGGVAAMSLTANFGQNPLKYTPPNGTFWNPKDAGASASTSNNNLTWAGSGANSVIRSNTSKSAGKLYWEITLGTANIELGICTGAYGLTAYLESAGAYCMYMQTGNVSNNGGGWVAYGTAPAAGSVIGVALDLTNGKLFYSINGTWQNSGNPVTGTNPATTGLSGTFFAAICPGSTGQSATLNTGATPFAYSPPSGYSAWDATVYNAGVY